MERVLSVVGGRHSSEVIKAILRVHFPDARTAIDPTWGKGNFWKGVSGVTVVGGDIDPARAKHRVLDCRDLPFLDNTFDVGVLDLPFMHAKKDNSSGTRHFDDFRWIKSQAEFIETTVEGAQELARVCKQGYVVKCKDMIEGGKYHPTHVTLVQRIGTPYDMLVFVPGITLANDPKWKTQQHFRRQESYFLVYKK